MLYEDPGGEGHRGQVQRCRLSEVGNHATVYEDQGGEGHGGQVQRCRLSVVSNHVLHDD